MSHQMNGHAKPRREPEGEDVRTVKISDTYGRAIGFAIVERSGAGFCANAIAISSALLECAQEWRAEE